MTIPSCMSGANRMLDSRDGAQAAVGRERVRCTHPPNPACSAGREKDAIVCGA